MNLNVVSLLQWQKENGLSGSEAARKIGITQAYYSELVNRKKTPSLETLSAIKKVTGLSIVDLMTENPPQPSEVNPGAKAAELVRETA